MKTLFDLLPLFVFFGGYYGAKHAPQMAAQFLAVIIAYLGITTPLPADQVPMAFATQLAMFASIAQVLVLLATGRKVDKPLWVTLVIVVIMSVGSLVFHDPSIIKWRSTVVDWFFGSALLVGELVFAKNLLKSLAGAQVELPDDAWRIANRSWMAFFFCSGLLNLFVADHYSEEAWVNFNMFGGPVLTVLFMLGQGVYLMRYIEPETPQDTG
jgi:intracellular septation protein